MTEIRKRAFVGIVGLVSAGLLSVGCSSSNNTTGTGGSSGSAGTSGGTAGTNGGGGTNSSGGGTTGTGGTTATVGCQISDAPASATIAEFASADGGVAIPGGISAYGGTGSTPTYTISGGTLNIMDTVVATSAAQYVGLVIYFNAGTSGSDCTDATAYQGVQFDISGTLTGGSGCSVQYSTNDSEHSDSTTKNAAGTQNDPKASGPAGSYSPQVGVTLSATSTPMMVPFATTGGSPSGPIDHAKITGVQWQLTVNAAADGGTSMCDLNMAVDNVKFY